MHKTPFRLQWEIAAKCWVWDCSRPFLENGQTLLFMQGKHLFYLKNKEKTPPSLFLCVKIGAACCRIVSLRLAIESCFLEKEGQCCFTPEQCIIDVENLTFLMENNHCTPCTRARMNYTDTSQCRQVYLDECRLYEWVVSFGDVYFLCGRFTRHLELDLISPLPFFFHNMYFPVLPGCSGGSVDQLCDLCDRLHGTLAEADMLGRRCKRRSGILRTLFRLIELNSAQLNLYIGKLCLAVSHLCVWSLYHRLGPSSALYQSYVSGLCCVFFFPAVCQWKQPAQHLQAHLPDQPQWKQRHPLPE